MKLVTVHLLDRKTGEILGIAFIDTETDQISDYTIEEYMNSIKQN